MLRKYPFDPSKPYCIYQHVGPGGKVYIGQTRRKNPTLRWGVRGQHYFYKHQTPFSNAIKKHGWDAFTHEVLYENLTKAEANDIELRLIKYYQEQNLSYNLVIGAPGPYQGAKVGNFRGRKHTEETRKKMSEWQIGRKHTEESKRKMSAKAKMRGPVSQETREKLSKVWAGRKHTEETRKKMSLIHKGAPYTRGCKGIKRSQKFKDHISKLTKGKRWIFCEEEQIYKFVPQIEADELIATGRYIYKGMPRELQKHKS